MSEANREAGRKGGLATLERYGKEYYAELGNTYGSTGGRPRRERQYPAGMNIEEGEIPTGYRELKRLVKAINK